MLAQPFLQPLPYVPVHPVILWYIHVATGEVVRFLYKKQLEIEEVSMDVP